MNLFETLKQFKNISPDPTYKENSKRAILATMPRARWSPLRTIMAIFETGIAVGLAVFFILIITGQFSNIPYVSPAKFSVINPETLHAEAQAVDIQIQLADVAYEETTSTLTAINETTAPMATGTSATAPTSFAPAALHAIGATSSSIAASTAGSSTTTSTAVSVDQALQALSQ